jgi:hypothetical protein
MIDAGRDAALHILAHGNVRGGADRVLAEQLHEACGLELG